MAHDPNAFTTAPAQPYPLNAEAARKALQKRAIALLSRREYSRLELAHKLSAYAPDTDTLTQVLDYLTQHQWLSDTRYAQSLVHRLAARQGNRRILHTLQQQGVDADSIPELAQQLRDTELERARSIWIKKFGTAPANAKEYARQIRFMTYRGFSPDILRHIIADAPDAHAPSHLA